jgi:hypothetical protein
MVLLGYFFVPLLFYKHVFHNYKNVGQWVWCFARHLLSLILARSVQSGCQVTFHPTPRVLVKTGVFEKHFFICGLSLVPLVALCPLPTFVCTSFSFRSGITGNRAKRHIYRPVLSERKPRGTLSGGGEG